jgi:type IV pilus assembly protein PilB
MFPARQQQIREILEQQPGWDVAASERLWRIAIEQDRDFVSLALQHFLVSREGLLQQIAEWLDLPLIEEPAQGFLSDERVRARIPGRVAQACGAWLFSETDTACHVAVLDPFDHANAETLAHGLGKAVIVYVGDPELILGHLNRLYPLPVSTLVATEEDEGLKGGPKRLEVSGASATIIDYVDAILQKAIKEGASDIHFEPFEHRFRVRYRVDGHLLEIPSQTEQLGPAIASRIKVMAHLNIAEKRVPQDGRIQVRAWGRAVDVRVSTLPTQFGESIVLRILDKTRVNLDLDLLGIPEDVLCQLRQVIKVPNGIFLATGPTGSGKTTTLYSALRELNRSDRKLLTVEDPVEYDLDGVVQVQTHAMIGLDFARTLRAFLRHDPDIILLGEIRDSETARIAVQASLTGHLVFSSLHTNDAVGSVTRLVDMGIEPYLVAASLVGVLAQRLLRRLNPLEREIYVPATEEIRALEIEEADVGDLFFWRPTTKARSEGTIFQGRVGVYEWLLVNDGFRESITRLRSHSELVRMAKQLGMRDLRADGVRALRQGHTIVEEVLRHT